MCATARLRESKLQRAELARSIHNGLVKIARLGGGKQMVPLLEHQRESHVKALEELAEAQYRERLLYYALCYVLEEYGSNLETEQVIAKVESMVLEAAVAA